MGFCRGDEMKDTVNTRALENFLSSLDHRDPISMHYKNIALDAVMYKWNKATVDAMSAAVEKIYSKQEVGV